MRTSIETLRASAAASFMILAWGLVSVVYRCSGSLASVILTPF